MAKLFSHTCRMQLYDCFMILDISVRNACLLVLPGVLEQDLALAAGDRFSAPHQIYIMQELLQSGSSSSSGATSTRRSPGEAYSADLAAQLKDESTGLNATDIYCPLGGCRCLLLRKGNATLVQRSAEAVSILSAGVCVTRTRRAEDYCSSCYLSQLKHPSAKATQIPDQNFPPSEEASSSTSTQSFWLVPSPMAFENIGFTKGVVSSSDSSSSAFLPEGGSVRYLACADCDCGPLGYHIESKGSDLGREVEEHVGRQASDAPKTQATAGPIKEFLIAVERCRYKVEQ